jgi:manganese/zinc/iron transport system permease protein
MCMAASLVGVLVFTRKRSLLGETLSHATYPGVIFAIFLSTFFFEEDSKWMPIITLVCAFFSSFLGLYFIAILEKRFKVSSDAALCFVLSSFFGLGILFASVVQRINPQEYKQMQAYLFGQAATMTDIHIFIYGILSFIVLLVIFVFYKEIKTLSFDINYAKSLGLNTGLIELLTYCLIILATVVGIRSVGVVLMSAMLIAPAVSARQYTNNLKLIFVISAFFGLLSGFWGNYLSLELSEGIENAKISFPTGPMIVIVASFIAFISLLFAPKRGVVIRFLRIVIFKLTCLKENILKTIWRLEDDKTVKLVDIKKYQRVSNSLLKIMLSGLCREGLVLKKEKNTYNLTESGKKKAEHIIRLHRLWEVYLANYLGAPKDRVHKSAEEMEHILTPELEKELDLLLKGPEFDPHENPIPPKRL